MFGDLQGCGLLGASAETTNFRQHHDAATRNRLGDRTMRIHVLIAVCIGSALGLAGAAIAQQPPVPATTPPAAPVDYGPPITNEQAKAVAAATFAEAKKNNWRMAFTIVGPAGELVYFEKMDGAQLASTEIAHGKARTSVMYRRPSKAFADQYAAGNTAFMTFPEKPVASEGGVPIVVNGKIIGAIGVSGGTGQQDGVAAAAGASAAK
jgi:glc operon protein GlcG